MAILRRKWRQRSVIVLKPGTYELPQALREKAEKTTLFGRFSIKPFFEGVVDGMNSSAIHVPLVSCFYKITTEPRSEPTSPLNWKQNR